MESQRSVEDLQRSLDENVSDAARARLHLLASQLVSLTDELKQLTRAAKEKRQSIATIEASMQEILDDMGDGILGKELNIGDAAFIRYVVRESKKPITTKLLLDFFKDITKGDDERAKMFFTELNSKREVNRKKKILRL